jgi:hypothetical protein
MTQDRRQNDGESRPLSRGEVVHILESRGAAARDALAARNDAAPEVLFFLASEGSVKARRAVAANPVAPAHANRLLADDDDEDVRAQLAHKIARLLPDLPPEASWNGWRAINCRVSAASSPKKSRCSLACPSA